MRAGAAAIVILIAVVLDLRRPPANQLLASAAVGGIHVYQATLSPVQSRLGVRCRFTPTCSHYAEEAIKKFGLVQGSYLSARRILRCGPWTESGTIDPVP